MHSRVSALILGPIYLPERSFGMHCSSSIGSFSPMEPPGYSPLKNLLSRPVDCSCQLSYAGLGQKFTEFSNMYSFPGAQDSISGLAGMTEQIKARSAFIAHVQSYREVSWPNTLLTTDRGFRATSCAGIPGGQRKLGVRPTRMALTVTRHGDNAKLKRGLALGVLLDLGSRKARPSCGWWRYSARVRGKLSFGHERSMIFSVKPLPSVATLSAFEPWLYIDQRVLIDVVKRKPTRDNER